jgi:hypothetical protein
MAVTYDGKRYGYSTLAFDACRMSLPIISHSKYNSDACIESGLTLIASNEIRTSSALLLVALRDSYVTGCCPRVSGHDERDGSVCIGY